MSKYPNTEEALTRAFDRGPNIRQPGWPRLSAGITDDLSDFLEGLVADGTMEVYEDRGMDGKRFDAYKISKPQHVHEPVPYNIHAGTYRSGEAVTGEITRKCATCGEWLASVPVKFPITIPIEIPS